MANKKNKKIKKKSAGSSKSVRRKPVPKKSKAKKALRKKLPAKRKRVWGKSQTTARVVFEPTGRTPGSAGQSGDLQGLSNIAGADSESVDELLEEGNTFEAEAVKGVQDALDADQGEVRTREVPEDDVPQEYLDRDE
jgi:hypothetical protein